MNQEKYNDPTADIAVARVTKEEKYKLPKDEYLRAVRYALQYKEWVKELNTPPDSSKAIAYDGDHVQTSGSFDPVVDLAEHRYELAKKKKLLEDTIMETAPEIYKYMLFGVAYGFTFWQLKEKGLRYEKDAYYLRRRKFYYYYSKKLNYIDDNRKILK